MSAETVRYWVIWTGFGVQIGIWLRPLGGWETNHLFWPFWVCFWLAATLVIEMAAVSYRENR